MRKMPQVPCADPSIQIGDLAVIYETMVPCIVHDDDVENPIRLIDRGGLIESVLADELVVVDRETFEMAIAAARSMLCRSGS